MNLNPMLHLHNDPRFQIVQALTNHNLFDDETLKKMHTLIAENTFRFKNIPDLNEDYNNWYDIYISKEIELQAIITNDGLQLPKTYAEIEELLEQGYSIDIYNPHTKLSSKIQSLDRIGTTYYIYTLDIFFQCENKNDYPFMYNAT